MRSRSSSRRCCCAGSKRATTSRIAALPDPAALKDAKTRLQEYLQARSLTLPRYHVECIEGEAHAQTFRVSCEVEAVKASAQGEGLSRRRAEQAAAQS